MALPVLLEDILGWLPKSPEYEQRSKAINELRNGFVATINRMISESRNEQTKEVLFRINARASNAVIETFPGYMLRSFGNTITLGENVKKIEVNPATGERRIAGPDVIRLPGNLLFTADNKLKEEGKMTQLHEWCHGGIADEFWTDVIAIRAGIRMGISKDAILGHIAGRRAAIGIGGELALYKLASRKFFIIKERIKQKHLLRMAELGLKPRARKAMPKKEPAAKRVVPAAQRRRPVGKIIPFPVLRRQQPRQAPGNVVPFARRMPLPRRLRRPA